MTYSSYNINTPSPYLVLHKHDKIPNILTIGQSNPASNDSVETDLKILTAHRSNGETLITKLTSNDTEDFVIPNTFLSEKFKSLPKLDAIKIGQLNTDVVPLLNKYFNNVSVPVIISGDSITNDVYESMKESVFNNSMLFVVTIKKAQEFLKVSKTIHTFEDVFELAIQITETTSIDNILITNCRIDGEKYIDVLFTGGDQDFTLFKAHTEAKDSNGIISTAISSNIAHGFNLKEAVYGALEYAQSTHSVKNDKNESPNYVYPIEIPLKKMVQDECFTAHELVPITKPLKSGPIIENFYEYLIEHPLVKPYWDTYVNHDFVRQIADGTLPLKKFQFFIEQDYSYLVDYGRVHCIAGSKSPELEDMEKELYIVSRIREEMNQHEKRLREEFGVKDDSYFKNIKRGPALNNYSRYFNDVAKRGNWQELVAALTPCMMGYGVAAMKYKGKVTAPEGGLYDEWIKIYSSENYEDGMALGASLLNQIARTYPAEGIKRLVRIYGEVCDLETKFWDAALAFE